MNIGKAMKKLKDGKKVARKSWNSFISNPDKMSFMYLVPANSYTSATEIGKSLQDVYGKVNYAPYIAYYNSTTKRVEANVSFTAKDVLAEDWYVIG